MGQVRLFVVGRALRYGRAEMLPLFCTSHTAWSLPAGTGILESCREPQLRPPQTPPRQSWTSPAPHAPAIPLRIVPCSRPFLLACLPQSPRCQTTQVTPHKGSKSRQLTDSSSLPFVCFTVVGSHTFRAVEQDHRDRQRVGGALCGDLRIGTLSSGGFWPSSEYGRSQANSRASSCFSLSHPKTM